MVLHELMIFRILQPLIVRNMATEIPEKNFIFVVSLWLKF